MSRVGRSMDDGSQPERSDKMWGPPWGFAFPVRVTCKGCMELTAGAWIEPRDDFEADAIEATLFAIVSILFVTFWTLLWLRKNPSAVETNFGLWPWAPLSVSPESSLPMIKIRTYLGAVPEARFLKCVTFGSYAPVEPGWTSYFLATS